MEKRINIFIEDDILEWLNMQIAKARANNDSSVTFSSIIRESIREQMVKPGEVIKSIKGKKGTVNVVDDYKQIVIEVKKLRMEMPQIANRITELALKKISEEYEIKRKKKGS